MKRLLFTFYSKVRLFTLIHQGPKNSPAYYFITVTDPNDLFLYFKSIELTHSKFLDITSRLNINVPGLEQDSKPESMISEHPKRARDALGYHPSEGAGGVVGVIAGDCLNGIDRNPDRYFGTFEIFEDEMASLTESNSSNHSETNVKSKSDARGCKSTPNDKSDRGWNEIMSSKLDTPAPIKNKEILRHACLNIKERVLYRTSHLISISFEELPREDLMGKVNDQYINLQVSF